MLSRTKNQDGTWVADHLRDPRAAVTGSFLVIALRHGCHQVKGLIGYWLYNASSCVDHLEQRWNSWSFRLKCFLYLTNILWLNLQIHRSTYFKILLKPGELKSKASMMKKWSDNPLKVLQKWSDFIKKGWDGSFITRLGSAELALNTCTNKSLLNYLCVSSNDVSLQCYLQPDSYLNCGATFSNSFRKGIWIFIERKKNEKAGVGSLSQQMSSTEISA